MKVHCTKCDWRQTIASESAAGILLDRHHQQYHAGAPVAPTVLDEAQTIVGGQRADDYGHALDSFTNIGRMWSVVLGIEVTAEQVALCMIGLKISRAANGLTKPGFQRDSYVDIAGYAACAEQIANARERAADAH